jgi:YYY domain-containing protein
MPVDSFDIILRWYLVTTIVTISLLPVALTIFRRVPGEGASFARPVAALLFMWPVWFLSGITDGAVPFGPLALWISAIVIAASGWAYVWRRGMFTRETLRHLLVSEAGYLTVFLLFLWFRGFGPDANFQEKPSDLMMLSSVMSSSSMPPQDAWMAGEPVNYYYLGYAIWGAFGNMAGATPAETFNLALISTFAMTFVVTAGLIASVIGRFHRNHVAIAGGVIGAIFVLLMGNPWSTQTYLDNRVFQDNAFFFDGIGWEASRVVIDDPNSSLNPITEFPAFSLTLGDLHPHVMALPFTLLALALSWMLLTVGRLHEGQLLLRRDWFRFTLAGGLIGSLYAMNSWDFPTYLVIALLALTLGTVGATIRDRIAAGAIVVGTALVAWLPFYIHFETPARQADNEFSEWISSLPLLGGVLGSISSYNGERTSPQEFFSIFGYMYLVLIALIVVETWRRREDVLIAYAESRGGEWEPDPMSRNLALVTAILCFFGATSCPFRSS